MMGEIASELNSLIEMLKSSDVNDRLVAIKTLQHLGDENALDALIAALQDENLIVQKLAVTVVWEFANPKAVPGLIECLASPNEAIREEARSALGELVSQDHLLLLLDALHREDANLQLNLLILLRKIHDAQALPYILPFFESNNPALRAAAITTLRYLNQIECCQPALALMSDSVAEVRRETVLTLGHLMDEEIISLLSQAITTDPDWQVRRNAAKALALHADPVALPAVGQALTDEHWQVRKFALQVLQKTPDPQFLPDLIRALTDEYSDVRRDAAIALGNLGSLDALNALQQALDDPDREVYIQTERAIQKIQTKFGSPTSKT